MAGTTKKKTAEQVAEQAVEQVAEQTVEQTAEQTVTPKPERRVRIKLPRNQGRDAVQEEFFCVNFKNYMIKRGVYVEVPEAVAEVIRNQEKEEDYAMQYVEEHALREA